MEIGMLFTIPYVYQQEYIPPRKRKHRVANVRDILYVDIPVCEDTHPVLLRCDYSNNIMDYRIIDGELYCPMDAQNKEQVAPTQDMMKLIDLSKPVFRSCGFTKDHMDAITPEQVMIMVFKKDYLGYGAEGIVDYVDIRKNISDNRDAICRQVTDFWMDKKIVIDDMYDGKPVMFTKCKIPEFTLRTPFLLDYSSGIDIIREKHGYIPMEMVTLDIRDFSAAYNVSKHMIHDSIILNSMDRYKSALMTYNGDSFLITDMDALKSLPYGMSPFKQIMKKAFQYFENITHTDSDYINKKALKICEIITKHMDDGLDGLSIVCKAYHHLFPGGHENINNTMNMLDVLVEQWQHKDFNLIHPRQEPTTINLVPDNIKSLTTGI